MFVYPYAGGGGVEYYRWNERVPRGIEICPLILPGRETRLSEAAFTSMPEIVAELLAGIEPHLDTPFSFLGHSMGAWVAYELVHALRDRERPGPDMLHVCARQAPQVGSCLPPLHELPLPRFVQELQQRWGAFPAKVMEAQDLVDLIVPTMRADLRVLHEYSEPSRRTPLELPIAGWWGEGDRAVPFSAMQQWQQCTSGRFTLRTLQGGHFFHRGPNLELIRGVLSAIADVRRQRAGRGDSAVARGLHASVLKAPAPTISERNES